MPPEPGNTLSHYRLIEKIGEGGAGEVYRAEDTSLARHVAIKLLRPELVAHPDRRNRFLKEARTAAGLTHPNIAVVHAVDEWDGRTFIVMELVEGDPLSTLIRRGPLELASALHIASQIASGLTRAHQARIVHRDLKPDNIVVAADSSVKILDFGLARILDDGTPVSARHEPEERVTLDASMTGRLAGTAAYMSPEQARGEPVDPRSDVFSFGVVLYEMLTGVSPFAGTTLSATLARVIEARPEPLAARRSDIPERLEGIVARCLSRDRSRRYGSAAELAEDLEVLRRLMTLGEAAALAARPAITIAVLPFTMRGVPDHAWLSAGVVDLMSTKLDGAGEIRSVDPHVVLACEQAAAGVRDPAEAGKVALGLGAAVFVTGSIMGAGDQLQLEAALYASASPRDALARASVRGQASAIFDMVDQLTAQLLARHYTEPGSRLQGVAAMATGSFPALKAYLEGEREMRAMRRVAAAEAYTRAVELDPEFGLAWYRLSVASLWSGQSARAREASWKAVTHAGRLSERDRHLMEAFEAAVRGDNNEAERRFRAVVAVHPDDAEAWYQLAEVQCHYGPLQARPLTASRIAWERLLQLDPRHINAMWHLAIVAWQEGREARFQQLADQVTTLSPASEAALWARASKAAMRRDPDDLSRVLEGLRGSSDYNIANAVMSVGGYMGDSPGGLAVAALMADPARGADVRARAHVISAHLESAQGRHRAAAVELARAATLDPWAAVEARVLLSMVPGAPREDLPRLLDEIGRHRPASGAQPVWLSPHQALREPVEAYLRGLVALGMGRPEEALAHAAALESAGDTEDAGSLVLDLALSLRAMAGRKEGRDAEALELLEAARMQARLDQVIWSPLFSHALPRFVRAELLEGAGRLEEAADWLRALEDTLFDRIYAVPALRARARILDRLGDAEGARAAQARAAAATRPDDAC